MIFDDHDIHDDWNTSAAWVEQMRATDWWDDHIESGLMSYWIYQHVGNLSPDEQDEDGLLGRLQKLDDGGEVLRKYARGSDREQYYSRWSYHRDIGRTRVVVIDSRCGRVLEEGSRSMLDEDEWQWVDDHATGGFDHLLIATSLPWLLAPAMHHLEAWNEAVCGGRLGRARGPDRREDPPGPRPRALGGVRRVVSTAWPRSSARSAPANAGPRRPRS